MFEALLAQQSVEWCQRKQRMKDENNDGRRSEMGE